MGQEMAKKTVIKRKNDLAKAAPKKSTKKSAGRAAAKTQKKAVSQKPAKARPPKGAPAKGACLAMVGVAAGSRYPLRRDFLGRSRRGAHRAHARRQSEAQC